MSKRFTIVIIILVAALGIWLWMTRSGVTTSYLSSAPQPRGQATTTPMQIISAAFQNNQDIPAKYTCDGNNINPPLTFGDVPDGTKSLALIIDDPDAPTGTWTHWLVWNLDASTTAIAENSVPPGAVQGQTSFGQNVYGGPCPPAGSPHHYHFKLYALDTKLTIPSYSQAKDLESAIEGHVIQEAEMIGLYGRNQ